MPTITIEYPDGTTAVWVNVTNNDCDLVAQMMGNPDSIRC